MNFFKLILHYWLYGCIGCAIGLVLWCLYVYLIRDRKELRLYDKLKCLFGFHRWNYYSESKYIGTYGGKHAILDDNIRVCTHCGKRHYLISIPPDHSLLKINKRWRKKPCKHQ